MTQQEINQRITDYQKAIKAGKTTKEFGEMMIEGLRERKPTGKPLTKQARKEIAAMFGR